MSPRDVAGHADAARWAFWSIAPFQHELPSIAERIEFEPGEIGGLKTYRTYVWCVAEFLRSSPAED